ncbi:hypothetical protein DMH04_13840 [Kibdelosporangium aridum]|uniref:Uncharacterized protein n=1 Tax=Kibdelosporangium aridum TaxID=2030 RepID=A0A428ZDT3_KIBAR|nr:hypothetical protein [Kibdelosporangium aridum]RSM86253.1 hypothetical protein DMH04_13840 [Kibdelosporangium aridum]
MRKILAVPVVAATLALTLVAPAAATSPSQVIMLPGATSAEGPFTGASKLVEGVDIPGADGLVLEGRRLWAVQFANQVSRWQLSDDLTSGTADGVITDPRFAEPVTAAKFGDRLAVVNSHLSTGFPPKSPTYEVVLVDAG